MAMFTLLLFLNSCSMSRQVAYFQNADEISLAASKMLYDAKIMPKDQLTITVITSDPLASAPFNLSVSNTVGTSGQLGESGGSGFLQAYLVDNNGNINFPVVGRIHVAGLTKTQCEDLIKINKLHRFPILVRRSFCIGLLPESNRLLHSLLFLYITPVPPTATIFRILKKKKSRTK